MTGLPPLEQASGRILLVVGNKCAGKTTLSDYVASLDEAVPIEASKVLRSLAWEAEETIDDHRGALEFLNLNGMDCVARRIGDHIQRTDTRLHVVSGLRTIEEILHLKKCFPRAEIVLIDSDPRIRFERHLKRDRDQNVQSFREFREQDEAQAEFGIMRVAAEISDEVLSNEGDMQQYVTKIREFLSCPRRNSRGTENGVNFTDVWPRSNSVGGATTCELISRETSKFGKQVRKYNTNRV